MTFEDLWILFRPGVDVYSFCKSEYIENVRTAGVVLKTEVDEPDRDEIREGKKASLQVTIWGVESDGTKVSRDRMKRTIEWFRGERGVLSLPTYPSIFQDREDGGKLRRSLEERGERQFRLIRAQPKQMWYDGHCFTKKKQKVRSEILGGLKIAH